MKITLRMAIILLLLSNAYGDEAGPPPITSETLIGVWEAAPSWANCVYRLEVNRTGPSYLAFNLGGFDLVYRLTSSRVQHGKVTLNFECLSDRRKMGGLKGGGPEMNHLVISGKGYASDVRGTFEGSLKMKFRYFDPEESTPVSFSKPPWTQDAARYAKHCEQLIRKAKSHQE